MAAIKKIDKQDIIDAAFNILQTKGFEQVSVRNIAKILNCSTKPVYFQFENMEELKGELRALAEKKYVDITRDSKSKYKNQYISHGMAYVSFAREEKHLFEYLYLNGREDKKLLQIDDANYDEIISTIMQKYEISETLAKAFHFDMAIYSYGLAVMVNTGFIELTEEEIEKRLLVQGLSLKSYYVNHKE